MPTLREWLCYAEDGVFILDETGAVNTWMLAGKLSNVRGFADDEQRTTVLDPATYDDPEFVKAYALYKLDGGTLNAITAYL